MPTGAGRCTSRRASSLSLGSFVGTSFSRAQPRRGHHLAEIGDIKKDIVHSGDTVHTAARIEAQCRPLERRVLVSEALVSQCQVPEKLELEDMGERELRGKVEPLRLYSVRARV